MKRILTLGIIMCLMPCTNAFAFSGKTFHQNKLLRAKVTKLHGKRAPGRDIVHFGLKSGKKPTYKQVQRYFGTLKAMVMPRPAARFVKTGQPYQPPAGVATVHAGGTLQRIAACESGGNPGAVDPSGTYRGKYQFDRQTWGAVGGSGDPAAASEAEQDKRAAMLLSQRGTAPWPVCGR